MLPSACSPYLLFGVRSKPITEHTNPWAQTGFDPIWWTQCRPNEVKPNTHRLVDALYVELAGQLRALLIKTDRRLASSYPQSSGAITGQRLDFDDESGQWQPRSGVANSSASQSHWVVLISP
jgi:hypothetical protein